MKTKMTLGLVVLGLLVMPLIMSPLKAAEDEVEKPMLRAAIFVQNRAGKAYDDKIDVLNDMITARLTNEGFSIINKHDVISRFREARDQEPQLKKTINKLESGNIEDALKDASALRLAQMIRTDYMIFATITSIGHITKRFTGKNTSYGVNNEVTDFTMRITLKVMEADQGGTVYGDVVSVSERVAILDNLQIETSDIVNNLLDNGALQIAHNITDKVESIRNAKVNHTGSVPFIILTNIRNGMVGAVVELDGAVIGSTNQEAGLFLAPPGIHTIKISREWCRPWEKTINIFADQKMTIALELSEEGKSQWKDITNFEAEMAKKAAETDKISAESYATRLTAEGEKAKLEASYDRIDTSKVERLSVGDQGEKANINVEVEESAK